MKKLTAVFFYLLLVCTLPSVCAASPPPDSDVDPNKGRAPWVLRSENGREYLYNPATDETISEAYRYVDDHAVPLPLQELLQALNASLAERAAASVETPTSNSAETDRRAPVYFYRFEETSTRKIDGAPEKVCPDVVGPAELTTGISITVTESYGGGFSLSASAKNEISSSASFTWNRSLATNASFETTHYVPAGSMGHVEFMPYLNETTGKLYQATSDPTTGFMSNYVYQGVVWGASPIRLARGFADGRYYLVTTPL